MSERSTDGRSACTAGAGGWTPGPSRPILSMRAVHVWRADLDAVGDELADALSDEERERGARIVGERERQLWGRARGVLRALLGRYLQADAGAVELAIGPRGKPQLADAERRHTALFFNLSHSRDLALYAFTADGPVGVDVQVARSARERPVVDHMALARRAFGEHEAQRLSMVEPARREAEFLRAWVRHEAELKRRGTGIGAGDQPRGDTRTPSRSIVELDVGARAAAALALTQSASELQRWDWA